MTDQTRIVVTGARRSGTTLAAAIIASSPLAPPFPGECQLLTRWIESHAWARRRFAIAGEPFFADSNEMVAVVRAMLQPFWAHCAKRSPGATTLVLKSPELAPVLSCAIDLIRPARIVATVRDPRDQVASEWRVLQRRRSPGDCGILERRDFLRLADTYVRYCDGVVAAAGQSPALMVVQFEDLVRHSRETIALLAQHLGLDLESFDPDGDWTSLAPSYWAYGSSPSDTPLYGKPIDPARVGAYHDVMNRAEADAVLERCRSVYSQLSSLAKSPALAIQTGTSRV